MESFGDCKNAGGDGPTARSRTRAGRRPGVATEMPPCFVAPPSLYDGTAFPRVSSGEDDRRTSRRRPRLGSDPRCDNGAYPGTSYDANGNAAQG